MVLARVLLFPLLGSLVWLLPVLLGGSAVTAAATAEVKTSDTEVMRHSAHHDVNQVLVRIDTLLQRYPFGLMIVRSALAATRYYQIDRFTFVSTSQSRAYAAKFVGSRDSGFTDRVAPFNLQPYFSSRRAAGLLGFRVHQFKLSLKKHASIEVIRTAEENQAAMRLVSESAEHNGLAASARHKAVLTAPMVLVQDGLENVQSLFLLPSVYGAVDDVLTRTDVGWSAGSLVIDEALERFRSALPDGALTLIDYQQKIAAVRFYAVSAGVRAYKVVHQLRRGLGYDWIKTLQPSQAFFDQLSLRPLLIMGLAGVALTLLAAALAAVLAFQHARRRHPYATLLEEKLAVQSLNASLQRQVAEHAGELEAARRDLRTILDAVPPMIGYWDLNQLNRFANLAYAKAFGRSPEAFFGQPMREVLGEQLYSFALPHIEAVLQGKLQVFERVVPLPDGGVRYHLGKFLPDVDEDGAVKGFYALISDITDIVESRQALASVLRKNDVLVRTINEHMLYSVTDTQGIILEVNDNFCAALGGERAELLGAHYRRLSIGQDDPSFWANMREAVMAGRTWNGTFCNHAGDGAVRWFDTVVAPYFNEHGKIEQYVALHTEVTARHAADAALRHVSVLLGNVLRAASEMSVIATDVDGLITVFNAGAERMLGYTEAEMVGCRSPMILHDGAELATRAEELHRESGAPVMDFRAMMQISERDGVETREWTYVRKDGSRFPVLLTVTAIRDETNSVLGFLGIGVDISARKRDDAILRESMQRAEQASVAKSQFVANISHEIRTPMNAMLGMLNLMLRTEMSLRQRDYISKARIAGATLLTLLNDVLDFSKIDAGKLELDNDEFEVDALLRDLAAVLSGNHVNDQVELIFDVAPSIPEQLLGDRQRIGQVLVNLAGNALKFTNAGRVTMQIKILSFGAGAIQLRFCVIDTGIGIPASQLDMIFNGFTQAEASTARRFGGTGLGLAISAHIVKLMGSTLQVCSEVGRGSQFWFDITLDTVDDAVSPQTVERDNGVKRNAPDLRQALIAQDQAMLATAPVSLLPHQRRLDGMRLLVVEDNSLNRQVAFELLGAEGAQVDLADGGEQGVNMATDPVRAYDAVVMDVQMPDIDGLEATRRIRALTEFDRLPIIAMTANASFADRDACLAAGMNSHIGKPFDINQVVGIIRALVAGASLSSAFGALSNVVLINLAEALPRFFDDVVVYTRFLDDFERESNKLLLRLEEEQRCDAAGAEAATRHALKGMALTMGAQRLAQALAMGEASGVCAHNYGVLAKLAVDTIVAARFQLAQLA